MTLFTIERISYNIDDFFKGVDFIGIAPYIEFDNKYKNYYDTNYNALKAFNTLKSIKEDIKLYLHNIEIEHELVIITTRVYKG